MWRRAAYFVLIVILAICLYPLFSVLWSSSFAARHDCILHEGFVNPCIVDGEDYGPRLYTAFVSGWFMLVTLPVAAVTGLILIGLALVDVIRWWRARR